MLYSYELANPTARHVATFTRSRAEPRDQVLVAFYARWRGERDNNTEVAARAPTWPFTNRTTLIEAAADVFCWCFDVVTLVF